MAGRLYLYTVYERIWHWLQAVVMLLLLWTGLEIHAPDVFGIFGFQHAVQVHTVLGFLLLANAFLGLFYHLTTGAIRQYIPEPRDFLSLAVKQVIYYVRGIFHGAPHPMEKGPESKLNPLQKVTYLAILNVLLPLQIVTGILIWGVQSWAPVDRFVGGLPFLVPLHAFVAWIFGAFVIMHIYLTTTGSTPLSNITAMITGWETVEEHDEREPSGSGK